MRLVLGAALAALLSLPAFAQTPQPAPAGRPPASAATAPSTSPAARTTVVTPAPSAPPAARTASPAAVGTGGRIDVNSATEAQLDALPGVGPARAKAIVAGRPYTDLTDLVRKKALPQGVFDGAKSRLAIANINTSTADQLAKTLPGIGAVRAKEIVDGRPYARPEDLVAKKVLTDGVFDKIRDIIAY